MTYRNHPYGFKMLIFDEQEIAPTDTKKGFPEYYGLYRPKVLRLLGAPRPPTSIAYERLIQNLYVLN